MGCDFSSGWVHCPSVSMRNRTPSSFKFRRTLVFSALLAACSDPDGSVEEDGAASGGAPESGVGAGGAPSSALEPASPLGPSEMAANGGGGGRGEVGSNPVEASAETSAVRVRFQAMVGTEPFACGGEYLSSTGVSFTPADLRLFVQDVALIASDGSEQAIALDVRAPWQLERVALIDFEDASGGCLSGTSAMNVEITGRVPAGDYRGLAFSNGVPEGDNHADPTRLPPPLQVGSMSWGWLQGYRFLMAEVAAVGGANATGSAGGSALLHLGSTACSGNPSAGSIVCHKPNRNRIRLREFVPDADVVVVDLAALFGDIDLQQVTTCHSSGEQCAGLLERVGVDPEDGTAMDGQAFYRVAKAMAAGQ
jgi:uncharacterized repeat protein (TIGR04052 family)